MKRVSTKEVRAWFRALLVASLGSLFNDSAFRISISLRLQAKVGSPHCCVCSTQADAPGHYALSRRRTTYRHSRHGESKRTIQRDLATAKIVSELEATGT